MFVDNSIGAEGAKALAQALTENSTLEILKLNHGTQYFDNIFCFEFL